MKIKSSELKGKKIAIGQVTFTSIQAYHMLKQDGVDVMMFFDKDYRLQHKKYKDTPIFPWANFYDAYVILTIPYRYEELKKMLIELCGYSEDRILFLDDILLDCTESDVCDSYDWPWLTENLNNMSFIHYRKYRLEKQNNNEIVDYRKISYEENDCLITPLLSVDVNNKCTLNCEYCYTQMPYYKPEEKMNYDMDEIIIRLDEFLDVVDYIPRLWILGGEPLLHPELHKLVSFLNGKKAQDKVAYADILTNGTILLSSEVIAALQENPLFWRVSVSPYGVHSGKQYEVFSQLNEAGIPYFSRYMVYWQKFGQVIEPESTSEEYIRDKCENCICRNLHLANGKLYQCPVLVHYVQLRRIPYDERNSFDCSKPYTKEDIRNYLRQCSPGMAYCSGNHQVRLQSEDEMDQWGGAMVPVAGQAPGILSYKRYDYD